MELTTNKKLQNIELATFHNLAGRTISGSMIMIKKNQSQLLVSYRVMQMMHEIMDLEFTGNKQEISNDYFLYTFNSDSENIQCYINWSDQEKTININLNQNVIIKEFYGNELYSTNKLGETSYNVLYGKNTSSCVLKPYSITLVKYNE